MIYTIIIKAISPLDGEMKTYGGPNVPGVSKKTAREYCEKNGLGYCHVSDRLAAEIPCKKGTHDPDWENRVDFDNLN